MQICCAWVPENDELYQQYHDTEWGVPIYQDLKIFEFLLLESFQAGLSWRTVLYKRENFRAAFSAFDPQKVALFNEDNIQRLLLDKGIIRNQLKIRAAVNNAAKYLDVQQEFGAFSDYIWRFTEGKPIVNHWKTINDIPASTPLSDKISKDLKQRGFKFVGSTIVYAHMQATGMVNDHTIDCFRHSEV